MMRSRALAAVLALAVVAASLAVTGCGGGADEPAETTQQPAAQAPAAPPPSSAGAAAATPPDRSPEEPNPYEPFPTNPQVTPKAVLDLIESQQPMIVYFYDSTQKTTNDENAGIDGESGLDKIMSDYRGAIDLVKFDIGRYVKTKSDGSVVVDPAMAEDEAAQQTVALANQLGVSFTPYLVIVDSEGYVTARFRGWDEYKDIELEVLRATS